ncbi:MAG: hypothetical protein Q9P44_15185 [Anaerolineae bacterium]|nr:hypothetical protein [Anaerolineae bacterium]
MMMMGTTGIITVLIAVFLFFFIMNAVQQNSVQESADIDWDAIADSELQSYLPHMKIKAIRRYRELTGAGLKEAKEALEYVLAHPEHAAKKGKSGAGGLVDTEGAGVRDLIHEGRIDEAVAVYASFMGVDEFTARDAIEQMQREESATYNLSVESMDEVRQLVTSGNKIAAIELYRDLTQLDLAEAKDEIDRMEREGF